MDVLEFTAEMTKALAWPAAIVGVGLLFKHDIRKLLSKLKSIEGPAGTKAAFAEEAKDLAIDAATARAEPVTEQPVNGELGVPPPPDQNQGKFDQPRISGFVQFLGEWVDIDPKSDRPTMVVIRAYSALEELMTTVMRIAKVERSDPPSPGKGFYAHSLYRAGLIDAATARLITRLRSLRDKLAVADYEPSREPAMDYYISVSQVVEVLRHKYNSLANGDDLATQMA